MTGEKNAVRADRALFALRICAFAYLLAMMFQEQIGAWPGVKGFRYLHRDRLLRSTIIDAVVLVFLTVEDPDQDVHTIGGNRSNRSDLGKQEDAIGSRVCNTRKLL